MQLTHPEGTITVDFYPEAMIAEACEEKGMKVVIKRFIQKTTFAPTSECGQPMISYRTITNATFKDEVRCRVAFGYDVTDFHTEKFQDRKSYSPVMC